MRRITHDFSWSKSRHEKFSECLRSYYLHYYRSWGGWEPDSPPLVRELYVLKRLNSRFTWAGSVVHEIIKDVLLGLRLGVTINPAESIERAHRLMRADYRQSIRKGYWKGSYRRNFLGLVEHEYAESISAAEWKQNWEMAKAALAWFFRSPWMALARSLRPQQWIEVDGEDFDNSLFLMEGTRVFAVPDFAYFAGDGNPVVVDWKTGKTSLSYDNQVLGYALYLSYRYQLPLERIRAVVVYLNDGTERTVPVTASAIDAFKSHFRESVRAMRALLSDPSGNVPKPEGYFPMTENLALCAHCVFRRICGREYSLAKVA